jgi:hypothetical protein
MKTLIASLIGVLLSMVAFAQPEDRLEERLRGPAPRIVNIINFIRQLEPRSKRITEEVLYQTVVEQVRSLKAHNLRSTFLLQYDALINPRYQELMKKDVPPGTEIGGWWEITEPHVRDAGMKWRGRFPWDWHVNVGFSIGYTQDEREKLVDVYMEKFRSIFGRYPEVVGSWFLDSHSLQYMWDRYHIVASTNCRDAIGTDGYTSWGGYWNQAYYPSRVNAYMPAQNAAAQVPVPIFRMLGSDPIYQYSSGLGGNGQGVETIEPACRGRGDNPKWVDWYFENFVGQPCLAYGYVQLGQENSFTWSNFGKGFELQMAVVEGLSKEGKIKVETLGESGRWFRRNFPLTPPTAVTVMTDHKGEGHKTVWYDSRFYRVNLLWKGASFMFRDIHLFDERLESSYYRKPATTSEYDYQTLPFVDGFQWSADGVTAGLKIVRREEQGGTVEVRGGDPVVKEPGKGRLLVEWKTDGGPDTLSMLFSEDRFEVSSSSGRDDWWLELAAGPKIVLPFRSVTGGSIDSVFGKFPYTVRCLKGRFEESADHRFRIMPQSGAVVVDLSVRK